MDEPKERLVVMQVQGPGLSDYDKRSYRTAIVEGLRNKYKVLSGDEVDKIVNEIFEKESRETIECDTEKCFQDIAIAFQAELIASCTVVKKSGGYILNLQINNVLENENILSKSVPCEGCNEFRIIGMLQAMAGGKVSESAQAGTPVAPSAELEAEMWGMIKGTTNPDDVKDFLSTYPGGKYASLAKLKLKQLERKQQTAQASPSGGTDNADRRGLRLEMLRKWDESDERRAKAKKAKEEEFARNFKPKEKTEPPPDGMVLVKGGCYDMGDTFGDGGDDEKPVHLVCLDDFFMDRYEVTQSAFERVMGENPSKFKGCDNCPVEKVTWHESKQYCESKGKRLPTEAEWEYAARSGGKSEKYAGTSSNLDSYAWYSSNSGKKTHAVGQKQPNGLGLYDMSGNVWEWVNDWYGKDYYRNSPTDNPKGSGSGKYRVLRGGSWYVSPFDIGAAVRSWSDPVRRVINSGFRCSR